MEPSRLFLERCEQVSALLESHKEMDMLDLAAKLRQLLFDQNSLVDTVNTRGIRLIFRVGGWRQLPPGIPTPTLYSLEDGLDPETSPPGRPVHELKQSEFGKYPVTYFKMQPITVKEVIRYATNVAGGVHHDPRPREEYFVMYALSQHIGIGGLPLGTRQLKACGRVTMRALLPLIVDVRGR